jgi:hypothetical protein
MGSDLVGSLRKITLDGVTYNVHATSGFSGPGSLYENTSIPTSGQNMRKMVKRANVKEKIELICNAIEADDLKTLSESTGDITMAIETAAGDVYRTTGWIAYEGFESEEGKVTLNLHPRTDWTLFANG